MDIISGLPDDVLIKILTSVETKVAVSTSILSKQWEFLWMWLPKLEYSSSHYSESECNRLQCFLTEICHYIELRFLKASVLSLALCGLGIEKIDVICLALCGFVFYLVGFRSGKPLCACLFCLEDRIQFMDRISGLSDELLIKILSFLPTKTAVSTSILSKQWQFLWMLLPKLEYNTGYYSGSDCEKLRCFLQRNLPLHRAPVLESFRLKFRHPDFKPEDIRLWVLAVVSRST